MIVSASHIPELRYFIYSINSWLQDKLQPHIHIPGQEEGGKKGKITTEFLSVKQSNFRSQHVIRPQVPARKNKRPFFLSASLPFSLSPSLFPSLPPSLLKPDMWLLSNKGRILFITEKGPPLLSQTHSLLWLSTSSCSCIQILLGTYYPFFRNKRTTGIENKMKFKNKMQSGNFGSTHAFLIFRICFYC